MLRLMESRLGATLTASGAIYAIRRACYRPLESDALVDDFASSEKYRRFDFVALLQESDDVIFFKIVVVLIRVRPKLHLFDSDVLLMLPRFMSSFV